MNSWKLWRALSRLRHRASPTSAMKASVHDVLADKGYLPSRSRMMWRRAWATAGASAAAFFLLIGVGSVTDVFRKGGSDHPSPTAFPFTEEALATQKPEDLLQQLDSFVLARAESESAGTEIEEYYQEMVTSYRDELAEILSERSALEADLEASVLEEETDVQMERVKTHLQGWQETR